jgi:hypothetical protein
VRGRLDLPRPTLTGVVAMALAAAFISWLALRGDGGSSGSSGASPQAAAPAAASAPAQPAKPAASPLGPIVLDERGLRVLVRSLGRPVYWLGPEHRRRYELQRAASGNVFLRYLPPGARAGDKGAFLTVGTYPFPTAYAATRGLRKEPGAVWRRVPGGWLAVYRRSRPTNIYLARPGLGYQIEVFHPSPARARLLVASGRLRPVG